jgi:hypothetical protein
MKLLVDQVNNAVTSVLYTPVFSDSTRGLKETGLGTCLQNDIAHQKLKDMQVPQIKGGVTTPFKPTSNLQPELHFLPTCTFSPYISLVFFGFIRNAIHRGIQRCLETAVAYPAPTVASAGAKPRNIRSALGTWTLMATSSPLDFSRAWRWARPWPVLGTGHGPK